MKPIGLSITGPGNAAVQGSRAVEETQLGREHAQTGRFEQPARRDYGPSRFCGKSSAEVDDF
jgi:hypothetical protein